MYKKAISLTLSCIVLTTAAIAQSTNLPLNSIDYDALDRLQTRSGSLSNELYLSNKPVYRKDAVEFLVEQRKNARYTNLSKIDRDNINRMESISGEWTPDGDGSKDSKLPWFHTFYKKQPDFVHVKTKDFFLVLNPIITVQGMYEKNGANPLYFTNRGVEARGRITDKLGFYTWFTDNQEKTPSYVSQWANSRQAVPGGDYYQTPGSGHYDYLLAGGYFDFALLKDHINVTFGYDKQFLGDGIRSLVISDFATSSFFLKLNTRFGRFRYQNLFLELVPPFDRTIDRILPRKYAAIHHLSINAARWLDIGIFESTMFSTRDFDAGYLNPIIFYRTAEAASSDHNINVNTGLDFKIIAARHLQFYGQFLLNSNSKGFSATRYAMQFGGKYFDAFTVKNLDLQGEVNMVRPYTYAAADSSASYTHYNQPLAHPLGANFAEVLGIIRYQPASHLYLSLKGMYYMQGVDTSGVNSGSDVFRSTDSYRNLDGGIINGQNGKCALMNFNVSYELKPNLFIDLGATHRVYDGGITAATSYTYLYGGLRLNFNRRSYDFF